MLCRLAATLLFMSSLDVGRRLRHRYGGVFFGVPGLSTSCFEAFLTWPPASQACRGVAVLEWGLDLGPST